MPLTEEFDLFDEGEKTYVPALDNPEAIAEKTIREEQENKERPLKRDKYGFEYGKRFNIKLFSSNSKSINLNNYCLTTRDETKRRNELYNLIESYAILEASSAGKKRNGFDSFISALARIGCYVNFNNIIVGRNPNDFLNTDRLKGLLADKPFNMSKTTAEQFIRCAKKAKILKKIGKNKDCMYMVNPIIHTPYYTKISSEIFFEFPLSSELFFSDEQFKALKSAINDGNFSREEVKRIEAGIKYERE